MNHGSAVTDMKPPHTPDGHDPMDPAELQLQLPPDWQQPTDSGEKRLLELGYRQVQTHIVPKNKVSCLNTGTHACRGTDIIQEVPVSSADFHHPTTEAGRSMVLRQELRRTISFFGVVCFSCSILLVIIGPTNLYVIALFNGGPVAIVWGWVAVSMMTICVALSLAEIGSAFPTSGGMYVWVFLLLPESQETWRPLAAWLSGWCNMFGQVTSTASAFWFAGFQLAMIITMSTGGADGGGWVGTSGQIVGISLALLVLAGLYNCCQIEAQIRLALVSALLIMLTCIFVGVALPIIAPKVQSADYVLTTFINTSRGESSDAYVFLVGLTLAQYSLFRTDGCFHVAEETVRADYTVPASLIYTLAFQSVLGLLFLLGITFCITNPLLAVNPFSVTGGQFPVAQIIWDVFTARFHHGGGAIAVLTVIFLSTLLSGSSFLTSVSRLSYAFSRDGAIPGSYFWHQLSRRKVPVLGVIMTSTIVALVLFPAIWSTVTLTAILSATTISTYISYFIPIFIRTFIAKDSFRPGPFSLGWWGFYNGIIACCWILFVCALFVMPETYPITSANFIYAGPVLCGWILILMFYWLFARSWFTGPRGNLEVDLI